MPLITCPDCGRQVSDRARECPDCACPVAEVLAEEKARTSLADSRSSRKKIGEVDCVECEARGYRMINFTDDSGQPTQEFAWCTTCVHTGRVILCESSLGYHAVAEDKVDQFLAGEVDGGSPGVHDIGTERPQGHRYPKAGPRGDG